MYTPICCTSPIDELIGRPAEFLLITLAGLIVILFPLRVTNPGFSVDGIAPFISVSLFRMFQFIV